MTPSRVAGGLTQSSLSSGIFFQGDTQSQNIINSHLSSSFRNNSNTILGTARSNLGPVSGDINSGVLNGVVNSVRSVGASSLVTDANSTLSGGPNLQRGASINTDPYLRLPASPMSFTSNNTISGSSVMDGSTGAHQISHQDQNVQQLQLQGASSAMSLPASQTAASTIPMGAQVPGSFIQDPNNLSQLAKKPRLDIKQEDMMKQQVIQQFLQRPDLIQMQGHNPQMHALLQQQQRVRQQQMFQSMPQSQRAHLQQQQQQQQKQQQQKQQQQQMQLRQQLQQQAMQPSSSVKRPFDNGVNGVCSRRLMQYLYHQRQRPNDNSIAYWRKFVTEYYSPRAKKRWCLSLYNNVGQHALGVFPQAAMDAWQCDICGSKSGKGFEATFEVLPRLNEIKFGSGVIDELLFLDMPREYRFQSGMMMLEYAKAVQESVYEQLRVSREGHLRIIFTQDLKILSWEFCARRHEELLPRRSVVPQVNQLVQVAQKCQSTITESGSDGVSQRDLQANSDMVLTAGRQLAKSLELQSLNELGLSKRYVRFLQISEVVNSMKDLIDICKEHKVGPTESLKNYPQFPTAAKLQMHEMERLANVQGLPTDRNTLNKLMAMSPGFNNQVNNNHNMVNCGALSGSAQTAFELSNYQNILMRQNSMNSSPGPLQREGSSSFNKLDQSHSSSLQGSAAAAALIPGSMRNSTNRGFPSPYHLPSQQQHQQLQQCSRNANSLPHQNYSQGSNGNQAMQQQFIQQLLQDMSNNNNGGVQQQSVVGGPNANGNNMSKNGLGFGGHTPSMSGSSAHVSGNNEPVSRSHSFKAVSNSDSSAAADGNNGFYQRTPDMPQNQHMQDIAHDFTENSFFNNDLDDNMGFGWKP
ncbi:PREDICTED: probable transcriptional regulator SLK2 isoform X1 [Lupinus angustifolius]|uniref:probable transcriptional regulator SLK2 isoform X1 n=1 Tax=Lupinus angustifolius TaxID=3871 RepID=UPI00092FCBE6|nr:PREDICTED: probable transcriptional regulator SLK2 isoform X1 [Lupinus angustifolius]